MIRKSEYYEQTERYLSQEMTQSEHQEYEFQLEFDSDLSGELDLQVEVDHAVIEQDVMVLRGLLSQLVHGESEVAEKEISVYDSFSFGLSEEFSSRSKLGTSVNPDDLLNFGHTFPQIHLYQHLVAGRENIHQFYRDQQSYESSGEEVEFSPMDEELFSEVQISLEERDVFDLRANLSQISQIMPVHGYTTEDIEAYVYGRMDLPAVTAFEEELAVNAGLAEDLRLVSELDLAGMERDIIDLRTNLQEIHFGVIAGGVSINHIERYLGGDMSVSEIASFEQEIITNSRVREELDLVREIDHAIMEHDVMQLRGRLHEISGESLSSDRTERSLGLGRVRIGRRFLISAVAASLVLLLGLSGLLSRQTSSESEIYGRYYSRYEPSGIVRSDGSNTDALMLAGMQRFESRDYETALSLFGDLLSRDASNMAGHFYSGVSYQETGRYDHALEEYATVISNDDNLFTEQAAWYSGLCYLQTGDTRKAVRQFRDIAQREGYYRDKAKDILRKLRSGDK
jgi:hypothetical protein